MNNTDRIAASVESLRKSTGVLSTIAQDGAIDSAVVYFTLDKNLNLYFFARANSRKSQNIVNNSLVSFTAYSEETMQTFQLRGDASLIEDPAEQSVAFENLLKIANEASKGHPPITQMMQSEINVFKMIPLWARFSDFSISNDGKKFEELNTEESFGTRP